MTTSASKVLTILLLAGFVGGCFNKPPQEKPPLEGPFTLPVQTLEPGSDCLDYMCRANPNDPNVQQIRQDSGLEKITNKPANHGFHQIEGDWVLWQSTNASLTYIRGDIWAMDLTTRELYGVRVGPGHSIRPFLDSNRVVFQYASEEYTGLLSWELGSKIVEALDIGIEGRYWLEDLQGDWIALSVGKTTSESVVGDWAVNTETKQRHHLYTPDPSADPAKGEQVVAVDLSDHDAYFLRTRSFDPEPSYWLHRLNLTTGQESSYKIPTESNGVHAGNLRVLVSSFPEFLVFDTRNETFSSSGFEYDTGGDDCTILAGVAEVNDWVTLKCSESANTVFRFYNLDDGTTRSDQVPKSPSVSYASSDGTTVAYIAARHGLDLYVKPLDLGD